MWTWLTDEANLKVLGAIGGVISFLWTVGWAIYIHRQAQTETPARQRTRSQGQRPVRFLVMLGSAVAIWAAGLLMVGTTWWIWKTYVVEKPPIVSYVCRAENGDGCPPGSTTVGCADATPAIEEVRRSCRDLRVRAIMNSDGGRCGHSAWELTCTPK
jgi:hypothetical protein